MPLIREQDTGSGRLLEADFYPVWQDGRRVPSQPKKAKRSTAEQARYDRTQSIKSLIRLVNANFDTGDIFMHPTYEPEKAPQDEGQARKNIVNYLRRVKYRREKELHRVCDMLKSRPNDKELLQKQKKLSQPFKYIYVIEKQTYKTGKYAGRDNWHYHLFLTGGLDRDTLEDMWPLGVRCNANRFQPERFGPESAARYMAKDPQGAHRFCCSKNLDQPQKRKPKDGRVTPRTVERMAKLHADDREYWERRYKGYRFIRTYSRYNPYNGYWYVSVVMYKTDESNDLPPWHIDNWITE